jgi:putative PIG3 family NAD(P)H quinone oxidoreductase
MKAVVVENMGEQGRLIIEEYPMPIVQEEQILVKVACAALNRADLLQKVGKYPPPPGASPILGLEISGEVAAVGEKVKKWKIGDAVFGLIPGGGYAEFALIHQDMAWQVPDYLDFAQAVAIPEAFLTAYQALLWLANLQSNEKVLIHAGASGVGTAAIQLAKVLNSQVFVTASAAKHSFCTALGADFTIDYKTQDFNKVIPEYTNNQGVSVVVDFMGADYFSQNIDTLGIDGRLVILGLMGGAEASHINLAKILMKRLKIIGSTLRARSLSYQIQLANEFWAFAEPKFKTKLLKPIIDKLFSWHQVNEAHSYMASNQNTGKIILKID